MVTHLFTYVLYVPIINQHRRIHLMYYDSLLAAVLQTDFVSLKEDRLLCSSFKVLLKLLPLVWIME